MKFHSIYNQNPPEPVILEPQNNPMDYVEEMIAEHNFEESYENQHIKNFDDMERLYFKELIKNEQQSI